MDFKQFTTEWKDAMVYRPNEFDFDEDLNDHYIEYKESLNNYGKNMSVKEWCEFFFADFDLDTHPYMLKEKAIKSKHGDGLRKLASRCFWNKKQSIIESIVDAVEKKTGETIESVNIHSKDSDFLTKQL